MLDTGAMYYMNMNDTKKTTADRVKEIIDFHVLKYGKPPSPVEVSDKNEKVVGTISFSIPVNHVWIPVRLGEEDA